ncbi:MAG: bifunctional UDP-N-acetylglucosamine diphosphorylase/glucosamine-1-phosphate N-acetyltransferase GlmU [Planctomycetota bacterium]
MAVVPHVAVLAAGEGSRLRAPWPKVLAPIWGRSSLGWVVESALGLAPERLVVVGGEHLPAIEKALSGAGDWLRFAHQESPKGTGHALLSAADALAGAEGPLLILYGDCPLTTPGLLEQLAAAHAGSGADLTVLTARLSDPTGYGRVVRDDAGELRAIVEERDADEATRAIDEVNTGVWIVTLPGALEDLAGVGSDNAQGEVYLTDLVEVALGRGRQVATMLCEDPAEVLGFNDHAELAVVREVLRWRILERHLAAGVEIVDPASTYIDAEVTIEAGARVLPCTAIEGRTSVGTGCEVGPFAHLRTGTVLRPGAEIGNFTETKKTTVGEGSKAKHLTYLGDTTIGSGTNIGAGTITANYDGKDKHATVIGDRAFIGSGTVLVAPSTIEDGATTGAGAIVTRSSVVRAGETWVGIPARPLRRPEDAS